MPRDYQRLVVWQRAHQLALGLYKATESFPRREMFGLTSQIRRAAYSVPANIVEGSARDSEREYLRFLNVAWASLKEVEYSLLLARDLGYLNEDEHRRLTELAGETFRPLRGLVKTLSKG